MRDLTDINQELLPLKALADRELASIYGLTGKVYTPHIDAYMLVSIKKAEILASLKTQGYYLTAKLSQNGSEKFGRFGQAIF